MLCNVCQLDIAKISSLAESFYRLKIGRLVLAINSYRGSSAYSYVIARLNGEDRPAIIQSLLKVGVYDNDNILTEIWIAEVSWYDHHQSKHHFGINSRTEIWSTVIERRTFIPVRFILSRFVHFQEKIKIGSMVDTVKMIIPIPNKSLI